MNKGNYNVLDGIERDIIINSYYVISFFNINNTPVTNLKLQKLMYFMEAIYMSVADSENLYSEEFYAWEFGPVCKKLYEKYASFESYEIELTDEQNRLAHDIPNVNYLLVQILYKLFGDWTTYDLVEFTHSVDSPWSKVYDGKNGSIIVDKNQTKEWFKGKINLSDKE